MTAAPPVRTATGLGSNRAEELRSSDWTPPPPAGAGGSRAEEGESSPAPHHWRNSRGTAIGLVGVGGEVCPVPLTHRSQWETDRPGPAATPRSRTAIARRPDPTLVQAAIVTVHVAGVLLAGAGVGLQRWSGTTITLRLPRPVGPAAHHPMGGGRPAGRSPAEATGRPVGGSTKSNTLLSPTPSTIPADLGGRVAWLGNPQATVAPTDTKGVSR